MRRLDRIPNGLIIKASEILPSSKAEIDLVVPHEGQGYPVTSLKGHTVTSELLK